MCFSATHTCLPHTWQNDAPGDSFVLQWLQYLYTSAGGFGGLSDCGAGDCDADSCTTTAEGADAGAAAGADTEAETVVSVSIWPTKGDAVPVLSC